MEFFVENINLLLFLPAVMCAIIGFNGLVSNKIEKSTLFLINLVFSLVCIIFSCAVFKYSIIDNMSVASNFSWITLDNVNFYLGTYLDKVSVSFLFVVELISILLQVVSYLKLKNEYNYPKLLFLQNLFLLGIAGCFISPNLFQTYLFCEVTGIAGYLLINFDFSNREESKAGIKSYIFNRTGDIALLFCVLTILYFAVVYNQLNNAEALSYANMNNLAISISSLLNEPLYIMFCSALLFVIVMKFMQAFIYITFENNDRNPFSKAIFFQNSLFVLLGIYLFLRAGVFFGILEINWLWAVFVLFVLFVLLGILNRWFISFCKMLGWIEKYIVETAVNLTELSVRALSYICCRFQAGNFQAYLTYSIVGLVLIFIFVLIFYEMVIKV